MAHDPKSKPADKEPIQLIAQPCRLRGRSGQRARARVGADCHHQLVEHPGPLLDHPGHVAMPTLLLATIPVSMLAEHLVASDRWSEERAKQLELKPLARIIASSVSGIAPEIMGVGPIEAIRKVLKQAGMSIDNIDTMELNEAFAAQVIPVCREVGIEAAELLRRPEGLVATPPPALAVERVAQPVGDGIQIGGDMEPVHRDVVAGVHDGRDLRLWNRGAHSPEETSPTGPSGQHHDLHERHRAR